MLRLNLLLRSFCNLQLSALLIIAGSASTSFAATHKVPSTKGSHGLKVNESAKEAGERKTQAKPVSSVEPMLESAVPVSVEELVNKPQQYLGKGVKFNTTFFAWSNLALDYRPAYRSSKTHLSFLVLRPATHIPLSELKLAIMIPKEKDPDTTLFAGLKDGDQVELVGKVFSSALDDPWVEVFKLKKLSSAADKKETAAANESSSKDNKSENKDDIESKPGGKE